MNSLRFGLYILATAIVFALAVTLARAGSTPTTTHEVVLLASAQDWSAPPYPATIYACTRSAGAPPCPVGGNAAQAVADLLNAGYHVEPSAAPLIEFGVALIK